MQRLSKSEPASGGERGGDRRRSAAIGAGAGASRLDYRQPSALRRTRSAPRRGSRAREAALRLRLGLSRQCRHHPGAHRHEDDLVLLDELRACLSLGRGAAVARRRCKSSATTTQPTPRSLLERTPRPARPRAHRHRRRVLDGRRSRAACRELADLAERYDAWLLVDDAHGLGVVGGGRGAASPSRVRRAVPLQMGTFRRRSGAMAAISVRPRRDRHLVKNRARTLRLFHRPAAGDHRRRDRRARHHRARRAIWSRAPLPGPRLHPRRRARRRRKARSCRWYWARPRRARSGQRMLERARISRRRRSARPPCPRARRGCV